MSPLFRLASPAGSRSRLSILIFHRVHQQADPLFPDEVDAERFDAILAWLKGWFQILPLDEAVHRMRDGTLPPAAAALSFDDGYADNHDVALPLLQRHGLACSFFIATDFIDGGRMWNDTVVEAVRLSTLPQLDLRGIAELEGVGTLPLSGVVERRQAIAALLGRVKYLEPGLRSMLVDQVAARAEVLPPGNLMMSSDQVRALHRAGMQVGGHTGSHPILARLGASQAADEIQRGKHRLEAILAAPVRLFAYPNGKPGQDYLPARDPACVKELGFDAAVATHWGAARRDTDPYQLPRFTPWDRQRWRFGARLLRNLLTT